MQRYCHAHIKRYCPRTSGILLVASVFFYRRDSMRPIFANLFISEGKFILFSFKRTYHGVLINKKLRKEYSRNKYAIIYTNYNNISCNIFLLFILKCLLSIDLCILTLKIRYSVSTALLIVYIKISCTT